MRQVRSRDTTPEIAVRRLVHSEGYRYRLYRKDLPGKPDLAFGPRRKVIFVHGCFWHGHGCRKGKLPKSRLDFWEPKIRRNKERDTENARKLAKMGWKSLEIWQCEICGTENLLRKIRRFLEK
jgi:DNA mismatch endonuclease (patch repair protein)